MRLLGELLAWIIGWDLTLEYAMGASTVSIHPGGRITSSRLLNIFSHQDGRLWLAYDHLDGPEDCRERGLPAKIALASDSVAGCRARQAFLDRVSDLLKTPSPALLQRAHDLLGAPHLFGMEIGL